MKNEEWGNCGRKPARAVHSSFLIFHFSLGLCRRQFAPREEDDSRRRKKSAQHEDNLRERQAEFAPGDAAPAAQRVNRRKIFREAHHRQHALERRDQHGIRHRVARLAGLRVARRDRAGIHRFRERAAGKNHQHHGQRKKRRDRKRQQARRRQPERRQQRHPAENDAQPARKIQREAAFGIQNLHAVIQRKQQRGVIRVHKRDRQQAVRVKQIRRDLELVKRIRREAHRLQPRHVWRSWIADLPQRGERARRALLRRIELHAQLERLAVEIFFGGAQVNLPGAPVARRHQLQLRLHLLADLPFDLVFFRVRQIGHFRALLQALLQNLFRVRFNFRRVGRRLRRAARHQNLLAQNFLLRRRQLGRAPLQEAINTATGNRQQHRVQRHDAQPFADPDLPARNRFRSDDLNLAFLDVARQRAARKPQRRKSEQRRDRAQRVGQNDLREPARRAVVLDDQRQADDRQNQKRRDDEEQFEPQRGLPRQPGDGENSLHQFLFVGDDVRSLIFSL